MYFYNNFATQVHVFTDNSAREQHDTHVCRRHVRSWDGFSFFFENYVWWETRKSTQAGSTHGSVWESTSSTANRRACHTIITDRSGDCTPLCLKTGIQLPHQLEKYEWIRLSIFMYMLLDHSRHIQETSKLKCITFSSIKSFFPFDIMELLK